MRGGGYDDLAGRHSRPRDAGNARLETPPGMWLEWCEWARRRRGEAGEVARARLLNLQRTRARMTAVRSGEVRTYGRAPV